jgi:hypothetical protein
MQPRMSNPPTKIPGAFDALFALGTAASDSALPPGHDRRRSPACQPDQRLQYLRRDACPRLEESGPVG